MWTPCSGASSRPCGAAGPPAASADSVEQPRPDFFPAPAGQRVRLAVAHGKRLELRARGEDLRADVEFGRPGIDDFGQAVDDGFLFGGRARILTGFLILEVIRCLLERPLETGRQ